jgi:hypothetical protein
MRRAYSATDAERWERIPGDEIVPHPHTGYTLGITIKAAPWEVWPWLVQMGQGRGGFYTHEWVENLLGAHIHNIDRIVPAWQQLEIGDMIRLTPDPYLGQPGQFMTVHDVWPLRALALRQRMPNGASGSWAFALRPRPDGSTRLLLRRRGQRPSILDRVLWPGYLYMDRGMLHGIRERAEELSRRDAVVEVSGDKPKSLA